MCVCVCFILSNVCYLVLSVMYDFFSCLLMLELLDKAKPPSRPLDSSKGRSFEFKAQGYSGHSTYGMLVINVEHMFSEGSLRAAVPLLLKRQLPWRPLAWVKY